MSIMTLLVFAIIVGIGFYVVRSIVRSYKRTIKTAQPQFSALSMVLLGIALLLLVAGTILCLTISDVIGGALAALGGFIGSLESYTRHKREALAAKE